MIKMSIKDINRSMLDAFTTAKLTRRRATVVLSAVVSLLLGGAVSAQDTQSWPVSRLGYGTLQTPTPIAWRGMGGVGIAMSSDKIINLTNPAGFAATDSLSFLLDIGSSLNVNFNQDGTSRKHSLHGAIDYVAVKLPLYKDRLALSAGFIPFSNVGYNLLTHVSGTKDENLMSQTFKGMGSLQSLYIGFGGKLTRQFFVGANVRYLFGKLTHSVHLVPISNTATQTYSEYTLRTSDLGVDLGAQYQFFLSSDQRNRLTLGATYSPMMPVKPLLVFFENKNYGSTSKPNNTNKQSRPLTATPHKIGVGMAWVLKDKVTLASDFTAEFWSKVPNLFVNDGLQFNDRYQGSIGIEFLPDRYSREYAKRVSYRAGVNYSNGYFTAQSIGQVHQIGASIGFGMPIQTMVSDRSSSVHLSIEYLHEAFSVQRSLQQDIWKLSLSINFNENWFRELKIY